MMKNKPPSTLKCRGGLHQRSLQTCVADLVLILLYLFKLKLEITNNYIYSGG